MTCRRTYGDDMRLLILSDLHHEVWRGGAPDPDPAISQPDVVVLAGDIDTGTKAVAWADATFPRLPVLYVHGNHEGYGHHLDIVLTELATLCAATDNVYFLHQSAIVLEGVRFLGVPLWTDFRLFGDDKRLAAVSAAQECMNDYRRIHLATKGYRKLRASDTAQFHHTQRRWLEQTLAEPFAGKTVVITHMAPSFRSVPPEYQADLVSAAFASNLDHLAEHADLWIHGHTHTSMDYRIGKCRVVANPRGYMLRGGGPENHAFDRHLVLEI